MITLHEIPVMSSSLIKRYTSSITTPETLESTIKWILDNCNGGFGSITIKFLYHATRKPVEISYRKDHIEGSLSQDLLDLRVLDIRAVQYLESGEFIYEILVIDSNDVSEDEHPMHDEWIVYTELLKAPTEEDLQCSIAEWLDQARRDPKLHGFEVISISMSKDYSTVVKVYGLITYKVRRMVDRVTGDVVED